MNLNRNKKSVELDLKSTEDMKIPSSLTQDADVFIENYKPDAIEKFGLTYSQLKRINPRLIYCGISGYGKDGPYKNEPAYGPMIQAESGLVSLTGTVENPAKVGVSICDLTTGLYSAMGKVLAQGELFKFKAAEMLPKTSRDDIAFWFFTSGSTGRPKGVMHLHHDICYAGLTYYSDVLGASREDRFLSGAKLYFSAGLGFGLYGPLIMGASTVLYSGSPSAGVMLNLIQNTKPSAFLSVPTLYAQMIQALKTKRFDISSVRVFATGGESLSPLIFNEWKELTGIEITEAIGSAEVCHHYISNPRGNARPGTCGKLIQGYGAKIVDDEGKELGANNIGKLLVKGESTFVGYWHMHEATQRAIIGEWINTGDMFYVDSDGYFHFCGRTDFSFKIHGLWVSPIEIENAIMDTGLVNECSVVPVERSDGIVAPVAYVVPKQKESPEIKLVAAIEGMLSAKISGYKIPKKFVLCSNLAKTAVGKLDRSAILRNARSTLNL